MTMQALTGFGDIVTESESVRCLTMTREWYDWVRMVHPILGPLPLNPS